MGKRRKPIDFDDKRLYYSIKEVADHFAVNVSLLRFWKKNSITSIPKKQPEAHANTQKKISDKLK